MLLKFATKEAQAIIDSSHEGVIVVDQEARITLINQNATKILGLPNHVIGSKITEFIPNSDLIRILKTGKKETGDIATILNKKVIINRLPIMKNNEIVGVVSNFQEINDMQKIEIRVQKKLHQSGLEAKHQLSDIVGSSDEIAECRNLARRFGKTDATVMILGDSGTGKELFAQGIHLSSTRAKGPFVALNCAALSESLLESELFGYEEGSFTGALKGGKQGLFELAHGGTIFLDEIGEMPLKIQAVLLRILEERQIRRIGGQKILPIDVRVIVATNRDLESLVSQGAFRKDLYFRLNVLAMELPLLRERLSDIPELIESILMKLNEKYDKEVTSVSDEVLSLFCQYDWPGNARELRNVMERMVLLTDETKITLKDALFFKKKLNKMNTKQMNEPEKEKMAIISVLEEVNGNKTKASEKLGIDRTTMWRKMKKYNL